MTRLIKYRRLVFYLLPWLWLLVLTKSGLLNAIVSEKEPSKALILISVTCGIPWVGMVLIPLLLAKLERRTWKYPIRTRSKKAFLLSLCAGFTLSLGYLVLESTFEGLALLPSQYELATSVVSWILFSIIVSTLSWAYVLERFWHDRTFDEGAFKIACLCSLFYLPFSIVLTLLTEPVSQGFWIKNLLIKSGISIAGTYALLLSTKWLTLEFKAMYAGWLYFNSFCTCQFAWDMPRLIANPSSKLHPLRYLLLYGVTVAGAFLLTKLSQSLRKRKEKTA